jgi:hypothetical protein
VYATDDATFSLTQAGASTYIGQVIGYESSTHAIVECATADVEPRIVFRMAAAGTAVTNTTTRTASASVTIKPGTLKVGSRVRVVAQVDVTASNTADTLVVDIGGAVGGTPAALVSGAAENAVDNEVEVLEAEFVVRSLGASGTIMGTGRASILAAIGVAAPVEKPIVLTTVNFTADIVLGCYMTWAAAATQNSAICNTFVVEIDP